LHRLRLAPTRRFGRDLVCISRVATTRKASNRSPSRCHRRSKARRHRMTGDMSVDNRRAQIVVALAMAPSKTPVELAGASARTFAEHIH
jgi:hypothetical protein